MGSVAILARHRGHAYMPPNHDKGCAAMDGVTQQPVRLAAYRAPAFRVERIDLTFRLDPTRTEVGSRMVVHRTGPGDEALRLDAEALELRAIRLDGTLLDPAGYRAIKGGVEIDGIGETAVIEVDTAISPEANTELSGLYLSRGGYFTQCEAEGFRRITCFPDRPDVMTRFTTTIIADQARCPVLLSNGNKVAAGTMEGGLHWARWEDPHPKPSYLFALVAGDLECVSDSFTTRSGRTVALGIHVRSGDEDRCAHAMRALKLAMAWDEQVFGLEYDLDVFNIAAVADFNMGAMENKGLNIFNTKYVLARPDTATDADYAGIDTVISHEYFHNWTGNRVTCRDWFQLSLKEGLTVFRDQEFSADQGSRAGKRIKDVLRLRASQFPEDAGPLSHPVRPETYVKIDNFYTATVYQKGAEVVRMIRTLIGADAFRAGMDLYFQRHDNQAVRIEDFAQAMQDASGVDLDQFRRWYSTPGTPEIGVEESYDAGRGEYTLTLRQSMPAHRSANEPLLVPVAMGLIGESGQALPTRLAGENAAVHGTRVLRLERAVQSFTFVDVAERPVPSLLREFSAPVRLAPLPRERLRFLARHDSDPFVRWESGQQYATALLLDGVRSLAGGGAMRIDAALVEAMRVLLVEGRDAPGFAAEALTLPGEAFLADQMEVVDVENIHRAREFMRAGLGRALEREFAECRAAMQDDGPYRADGAAMGRRALKTVALGYLCAVGRTDLVQRQFEEGANMTDVLAALGLLNTVAGAAREAALAAFHARWRGDDLVLDKWFALQGASPLADTLARVRRLAVHADFSWRNPNRVYALVGSFAMANPLRFHAADGSGHDFLADAIMLLDGSNTQMAARLVPPLGQWRRHEPGRRETMRAALARILAAPSLSAGVREMAQRSLS